jgi:drug/metabolite transporter (DMT)-like permease
MIATFIIEILLAIYSFIKSLKAKSDFNIVLTLIFLAIFQLSEYQICGGFNPLFWSRLGLFSITFLPVLGFYLITKISKKSNFLKFGFILAIAFVVFFVLVPHTVEGAICGGNYIIFDIKSGVNSLYGYYYFGFLILGIWESIKGIKSDNSKKKIKEAFKWFIIGYLSFILPLTLVYIFIPITRVAIASIMCGFAVIFAFILAFKIAPIYYECVKVEQKNFKEKK